jgi:hypothetical protein
MAADALTANEYLRCGLDVVLGLEGVNFLARRQLAVFDRKAFALQKVERFQTIRADMAGHPHAVDNGGFCLLACVRWRCNGSFGHGRSLVGK